jgi:preprotein translocase subunit SecE
LTARYEIEPYYNKKQSETMEQIKLYLIESYNELVNKVTWPTWANLLASTRVVLVGSLIIALLVLLMDAFSKQFTELLYNI